MRLIDHRQEIAGVAQKWKDQYFRKGEWATSNSGAIYERLAALPADATKEDVAAIIGNDTWIGDDCTECGKDAVILVGEEQDYESHTVFLCLGCAQKVIETIEAGSRELDD